MSDDNPLSPAASPLLEADPNSINDLIKDRIDEIFNTKPLLLNDDQLRIAVAYYRKERLRFMQESMVKQSQEPKKRRKTPTSVADALATPMEDLL
jgi:hypothetical protein